MALSLSDRYPTVGSAPTHTLHLRGRHPWFRAWALFGCQERFRAENLPDNRRPGYDGLKEDSP